MKKMRSLRPSLLPAKALRLTASAFTAGLNKCGRRPEDWKKCDDPRVYIDAAMRHMLEEIESLQSYRIASVDAETGVHTIAHAIASLMIALEILIDEESYRVEEDIEGQADDYQYPEYTDSEDWDV